MNSVNLRLDEIIRHFSQESSYMIKSYIQSLKDIMIGQKLGIEEEEAVLNGIFDYIDEYIINETTPISFSDTLSLIDQLGSPSEILSSFNLEDLSFEMLEERTIDPDLRETSGMLTAIQNNPYTFGIFGTYLILIIINLIWELFNSERSLVENLQSSMLAMIIPGFVFGIIIGYFIDETSKEGVTLESKYRKIVYDYEKPVIAILAKTYIITGPLFGAIAIIYSSFDWYYIVALAFLFAIIAGIVPMRYVMSNQNAPKPGEVRYLDLLTFKSKFETYAKARVRIVRTRAMIIGTIIAVILFSLSLLLVNDMGFFESLLSGAIFLIMSNTFSISYFSLGAYSWERIKEDLHNYLNSGSIEND
ncbi:MAG: hypothetical protein INQ03_13365 [Candidatus Heimdallarchaeota archaeon]|nr:hypothetical protein [Candidatus Heimdallarchaeota archaeon]